MKTWDSKVVAILANYNVVTIGDEAQLKAFKAIAAKVGLDAFPKQSFADLVADVERWNRQHNKHFSEKAVYYACYQNHKGFGFWQDEVQALVDWYGVEPISIHDLVEEVPNLWN